MNDFAQTIHFLDDLYHLPLHTVRQVGLQRVARLLDEVGNPHRAFRVVHSAGSAGKGSTTSMVGSILQAAGYRTGFFRSPHLTSYTERITVGGVDIREDAWVEHFTLLQPIVEAMRDNRLPAYDLGRPSFFEVLFALMALHFQSVGVEWAAIETGLGGRLDATNLLQSDVAVVTNVSLEHTHILGRTVPAIAREKAAIFKAGSSAVTASRDPAALDVIRARAQEVGAPLLEVGRDVLVTVQGEGLTGQRITLCGPGRHLETNLAVAGHFQAINAATAYAAMVSLESRGVRVGDKAISEGLQKVRIPGRFEMVSRSPLIVVDGAHHPAKAQELARSIETVLGGQRVVLLVAAMSDKDLRGIGRELGPLAETVVVTEVPDSERGAPSAAVAEAFAPFCAQVIREDNVDRALDQARRLSDPDGALVITGSLYLAGYARSVLGALEMAR